MLRFEHRQDFLLGVGGFEHRTTRNKHIAASLKEFARIVAAHSTVNLYEHREPLTVNHRAQLPNLVGATLDETLTSKAGLHTHNQHQVELGQKVLDGTHWGCGFDAHTHLGSAPANQVDALLHIVGGLDVERNKVGTRFGKAFHILLRLDNHQVYVHKLVRRLCDGFQHRESKRNIGHKHAVHNVDVYPLGRTAVNHLGISLQVAKVGR